MAISQGSNLINVVVHNSADSRNASLSAIILSHVLVEGENSRLPKSPSSLCADPAEREAGCMQTGAKGEEGGDTALTPNIIFSKCILNSNISIAGSYNISVHSFTNYI